MTCGSGRSGKSTASLAYTPSLDRKSGMPQLTDTPAPVSTVTETKEVSGRTSINIFNKITLVTCVSYKVKTPTLLTSVADPDP